MRYSPLIALCVLLPAALVSAQGRQAAPAHTNSPAIGRGEALISGTAIDADLIPIPSAPVRLRNLESRLVEQRQTASTAGQFTFAVRPGIPYVVEIADASGRIVAVGDVLIPQAGEVVGALVAIAAKVPTAAGLFTDSLGSVISAAAGMGVTAVETTVLPFVSPEK